MSKVLMQEAKNTFALRHLRPFHIVWLTYTYLIVCLSVADALEFELVERVSKLPLGIGKTWKTQRKKVC